MLFLFFSFMFFIFKSGRFIFILISLEFLMMSLFFYYYNDLTCLMFFYFLVLSVVSSILGMLMMISLVKYFGYDKVIFCSIKLI